MEINETSKAKKQAKILLLIGLAYFIWPFDLPTFIDDAIVNVITGGLSGLLVFLEYRANKAIEKASIGARQKVSQAVSDGIISEGVADSLNQTVGSVEKKTSTAVQESIDGAHAAVLNAVQKRSSNLKKPEAF